MATPTTVSRTGQKAALERPTSARTRPVIGWAIVGAAFLLTEAYALTGWIVSGRATPTPVGPTPVPTWMKILIHGWEILSLPLLFTFLYFVLIRPWKRQGRITTDGLLCLVFATIWWQDPLSNWIGVYFTYNSEFINFGNWINSLPGWIAPNVNLIGEPPIWTFSIYVYLVFGRTILACALMRKAQTRWPGITPLRLIMGCIGVYVAFFAIFEPFLLRIGFYAYPSAIKGLTFNYGKYYQFPIYEALLWGSLNASWACIRYFRDDKGYTLAERGIEEVRITSRKQTVVRFLALAGVCNALFFCMYNVPIQFFIANSSPWPADIVKRSYLTDGLCGPGTTYACPGPAIPLNRRDSVHVDPAGNLVVPKGTKIPVPPPQQ